MSVGMGGRPRRPARCRHLRRTSARCHRSSVRGVTRRAPCEGRGRWHAAAARPPPETGRPQRAATGPSEVASVVCLDVAPAYNSTRIGGLPQTTPRGQGHSITQPQSSIRSVTVAVADEPDRSRPTSSGLHNTTRRDTPFAPLPRRLAAVCMPTRRLACTRAPAPPRSSAWIVPPLATAASLTRRRSQGSTRTHNITIPAS